VTKVVNYSTFAYRTRCFFPSGGRNLSPVVIAPTHGNLPVGCYWSYVHPLSLVLLLSHQTDTYLPSHHRG